MFVQYFPDSVCMMFDVTFDVMKFLTNAPAAVKRVIKAAS